MITEIRQGIINALSDTFPECEIYRDKMVQGFEEPCFSISIVDVIYEDRIMTRQKINLQFNITYFPKSEDEPLGECLEVLAKEKECLSFITLENGDIMRGTNFDARTADDLLQVYVNYNYETIEQDEGNTMTSYEERRQ